MVDINDTGGQKSLSSLQKEFPAENVFFAKVDISDTKQLVRLLQCQFIKYTCTCDDICFCLYSPNTLMHE